MDRKGVAGLTIFGSVVVTLFLVGLIAAIYAMVGGEVEQQTWDKVDLTTVNESSNAAVTENAYENLAGWFLHNPSCSIQRIRFNATGANHDLVIGNYTTDGTGCRVKFNGTTSGINNNTIWNITYTILGYNDTAASGSVNTSKDELNTVTDWINITIIIGAMVVLIMLVVIVISAIKGTGMIVTGGGTPKTTA